MKKFFTTLCLMVALALGTTNASTTYFADDFSNGLGSYTVIDGDGLTASSIYSQIFGSAIGAQSWFPVQFSSSQICAVALSNFEPAGTADDWMISPEIAIGENVTLEWYALSFSQAVGAESAYGYDGYEILVSDNGGTTKEDFTTVVFSTTAENGEAEHKIQMDDFGFANKTVRFAIHSNSTQKLGLVFTYVQMYTPDEYDLQLASTTTPANVELGSQQILGAKVYNYSGAAVSSFDLTIQEEGGEAIVTTFSDLTWAYGEELDLTSADPWLANVLGSRNLTFTVGNINGVNATDATPENNTLVASTFVYDNSNSTTLTPLYEQFTSSTCGPCYSIGETYGMTALTDKNVAEKGLVLVKYQMNWPGTGDTYFNNDGGMRQNFYEVTGVPAAYGNGSEYEFTNENLSQTGLDKLYDARGFYTISNASYTVDEEAKTVNVKATIAPVADFTGNDVKVHVALFEFKTTGNVGSNGETEFHHVMHKMLPNGNGTAVTALAAGSEQIIELTGDMSATHVEEMSDLGVAIFVQNATTHQIYQAAYAVKGSGETGVKELSDGSGIIGLYPNPANNATNLKYAVGTASNVSIELFDATGSNVYNVNVGNLSEGYYTYNFNNLAQLSNGQYFVRLNIGGNTYNDVLNIVR